MDWVALISGLGLGALGAKLLDILWLQNIVHRQASEKWLKDKRLDAFSEVTKEFISFGLHGKALRSPFESYAAISRALLLIDDDELISRIDQFVVNTDRMNRSGDEGKKEEAEKLYFELVQEARGIAKALRKVLLHEQANP
jgi:hypothetical protein